MPNPTGVASLFHVPIVIQRLFAWQAGYGVFSVSASNLESVRIYIEKQEVHHARLSFQDEFRSFLEKHGVAFDEKYVWD